MVIFHKLIDETAQGVQIHHTGIYLENYATWIYKNLDHWIMQLRAFLVDIMLK